MPEIGTTLREARLRQRIDISEVEAETKIRAKYLRALENEEWNLLPGTTYVKSFLKTYADELGLDGRLLVEEYKLRHERLSDIELLPIAPPRVRDRGRAGRAARRGGGLPRGWLVALVVAGLLVALYALGSGNGNDNGGDAAPDGGAGTRANQPHTPSQSTGTGSSTGTSGDASHKQGASPAVVRLQVLATGPVYVCLTDARDRPLIPGSTLQAGAVSRTFRSSRFRINLGNGNARLRINGRLRAVPPTSAGIGYDITKKRGRVLLPAGQRPTCG